VHIYYVDETHIRFALGLARDIRRVEVRVPKGHIEAWKPSGAEGHFLQHARFLAIGQQLPPMITTRGTTAIFEFRSALWLRPEQFARITGRSIDYLAKVEHPRYPAQPGEREAIWTELALWAWRRMRRQDRQAAVRARIQEEQELKQLRRRYRRALKTEREFAERQLRIQREQRAVKLNQEFESTVEFYRLAYQPWFKDGNPVAHKQAKRLLGIEDEAAS